jgi:dihydropteroate synthase
MNALTQNDFDAADRRLGGYGRTLVMGILNVTPDSFSDGGRFSSIEKALAHATDMVTDGADFLDIGAESTRPGHDPISEEEEIRRLLPVLQQLKGQIRCPISIDTTKAKVAEVALQNGATIVNDIWGLQKDSALADVAAHHKAGLVLMHNRAEIDPSIDIVEDMLRFLDQSIQIAVKAGNDAAKIALDPGIGFGKSFEQNLEAIVRLSRLKSLGFPILVGASRKSMIGKIVSSTTDERLPGTLAAHTVAILKGAEIVRVHDVRDAVQAARVTDRLKAH